MQRRSFWKLGSIVTLGLTLALFGCGDGDDGPTGPGGGGGGGGTTGDTEAVAAAEFAAPVAVAMVEQSMGVGSLELDGLNTPPPMGFAGISGDGAFAYATGDSFSITWDGQQQEYVVVMLSDQMPAAAFDLEHRVQYRDSEGVPQGFLQESVETTDGARFTTDASMFMDMGMLSQDESIDGTMDIAYDATSTLSGLLGDTHAAVGSGNYAIDVDMTVETENGTQSMTIDLSMAWAMDVTVPAQGGCPTGTSSMTYDGYRIDVLFTGGSSASWTLTRVADGASLMQGQEDLRCGMITAR